MGPHGKYCACKGRGYVGMGCPNPNIRMKIGQPAEDWEKRYELEIGRHLEEDFSLFGENQSIKEFIRHLLETTKKQMREEVIGEIEKEVLKVMGEDCSNHCRCEWIYKEEVLRLLSNLKEK